jgi:hypothetical protein
MQEFFNNSVRVRLMHITFSFSTSVKHQTIMIQQNLNVYAVKQRQTIIRKYRLRFVVYNPTETRYTAEIRINTSHENKNAPD